MNKHLSVFKLLARSTIWKVLAVLLLMTVTESLLFFRQEGKLAGQAGGYYLESLFYGSYIFLVFLAAYVAISAILYGTGSRPGSRQDYTLQRLGVSGYAIIAWQSLWNLICFLLLWTVQLLTVYLLLQNHLAKYPYAGFTQHHIFLAFWRHDVLHGLLPTADTLVWLKDLILLLAVSMITDYGSYVARRAGKGSALYVFMFVQTVQFFRSDTSSSSDRMFDFAMSLITAVFTLGLLFYMVITKYELEPSESAKEDEPCEKS